MTNYIVDESVIKALNELTYQFQKSGSCTGDYSYDTGYENGQQSAGYDLEKLLRENNLWNQSLIEVS